MAYDVTVRIVLARYEQKSGKRRVKVRCTHRGKQKYINTSYSLTKEQFDSVMGDRPRGRNLTLRKSLDRFRDKVVRTIDRMDRYSFVRLKTQLKGKPEHPDKDKTLIDLFDCYIDELEGGGKLKTASMYRTVRNRIEERCGRIDPPKVDKPFCEQFEEQMISEGLSLTTVGVYMRHLRKVINDAVDRGMIEKKDSPFGGKKGYKIPAPSGTNRALTASQINAIKDYPLKDKKDAFRRDLFLFSFYCFGINLKDIVRLRWKDIQKDRISFYRGKTKGTTRKDLRPVTIPIMEEARQIIERWGNHGSSFVFGIISESTPTKTVESRWHNLNRRINRVLRRIAADKGWDVRPTYYFARHSITTMLYQNGVSEKHLQDLLGHKSFETTLKYVDSLDISKKKDSVRGALGKAFGKDI